jgi:2-polyprenyl-3-methyl-5-hydroxy-6-metoxy-1,4-benzoquinol methylase
MLKPITQPADYYDKIYFQDFSPLGIFHRERIARILATVPSGSVVLDLGCSSGLISNLLLSKKCHVTGVDNRSECIDYARQCSTNEFIIGDVRRLNLGKRFEVVICSDVIEHFSKMDRTDVLNVINDHLASNGLLILTTPGWLEHLIEPLWKVWRRLRHPGVVFDDEGIHDLVKPLEIKQKLGSGYEDVSAKFICLGLCHLQVVRKSR